MRKVIRKLYFAWQIEEERSFLEDMATQGWFLDKVRFGKYEFYKDEPKDVVYDMDFQIVNKKTIDDYLSLTEGWKLADHYGAWFYFFKEKVTGESISLYSDYDSKRRMFGRLLVFLGIVGLPLYINLFVIFPSQAPEDMAPFTFYYFFRIITIIFIILHGLSVLHVFHSYRKYRNHISQ